MKNLLKLLKTPAWQERLAMTDVWATRFTLIALVLLAFGSAAQAPTEETILQAGLAAQGQQEYWRAESFFQQAALIAPDDFQPLLDLARLHLLEHRDALVQSELETARTLANDNADIWLTLGDVAQDQGHLQDAEHAWLQAARLNPVAAQVRARQRLGLFYEQQGRWQDAETQFAALPGSDALAQYHLGVLRLARGDRAGARQAFEAALEQTDDGAWRDAAQQFLQVIDQWNGSAASEKLVGFAYIKNNFPGLATAPLKQAVALAPKDAAAHAYLGWTYLQAGSSGQARQEENRAVALDPGNSFASYTLSLLDLADGRYSSAIHDLEQGLSADPRNPALWATRGAIAEQLRDLPGAELALRQAAANAGGDPRFSLLLANFYVNHQIGLDQGTALAAARLAIVLDPTNGLAYDTLGRIQQAVRAYPDAMSAFIQAANLAPTNAALHMHLGTVQATLGYLRSAELNLRKAIVLDFNGPVGRQAQQALQALSPLGI
ncbi:MAG TPA: tetratricopeptide repeat protein [Ktedonobacterales bacterium]|jgi:Flp pilus assembly protein TadD